MDRLEATFVDVLGLPGAVATASGTAALHLALLASGVQPDDEVLVSDLTFIAPANAVRYVGAWPVFVDAEPQYWQMDPAKTRDFLENECDHDGNSPVDRATGRRVRAILPVHILGHPCDMDEILDLARAYNLLVIEDATESLGATYKGRPVGTIGDIACFSFNGNKIVTAGGGGMLVTQNEGWARQARYLSTQAKDTPDEYVHGEIGYNYRLTNMPAALGLAQFEQLGEAVEHRRQTAQAYRSALADIDGVAFMAEAPWATSTFWLSTLLVEEDAFGMTSRQLGARLAEEGIETRPLWQPLHASPAHAGARQTPCDTSSEIARRALSLPSSHNLAPADVDRIASSIRRSGLG